MLKDLFHFIFPNTCACCDQALLPQESVVCISCQHQLPLASISCENENTVKKVFYGRIPLKNATTLLYFYKKGITQRLLHQLKYRGKQEVSAYLGEWMADVLADEKWMAEIDMIIPVPLHKKRLRKRGYNQVEGFGKALAKRFDKDYVADVLVKHSATRTQVFKSRLARTEIDEHYFNLKNKEKIAGKHLLLVDDIVTTGATLETCASILLQAPNTKISIATMALTV